MPAVSHPSRTGRPTPRSLLPPVHPHLHFVSHLQRSIKAEQLIAQLFRCIPDQSWLYKFGRVPMSFVMSDWVWTVRMPALPPPRAH